MRRFVPTLMAVAWLILLGWGLSGVVMRFTHGHELASYGSYVPWGLWVSGYVYFLGLSEGLFFVAALAYVFQVRVFEPVGRLALFGAAVWLPMGLLCIWFDLGHMERVWAVLVRPDFSSLLAWMVWAYNLYIVLVLAMLWFELRCDLARRAQGDGAAAAACRVLAFGWRCPTDPAELTACHLQSRRVIRGLGIAVLAIAFMAAGGVGALFASLSARPYWNTGLFPILFIVGDFLMGLAFLAAVVAAFDVVAGNQRYETLRWLGWLMVITVGADLLLEWAEFSHSLWYGIGPEADLAREILFGRFWWAFWVLHLALGSVVPVALVLIRPIQRWAYVVAGGLVVTTYMAVRLNIVIPGQVTPALRGLAHAYRDDRLRFEYVPSAFEWSVVAFAVAVGLGILYAGYKLLPLADSDAEAPLVRTAGS